ncbi:arginine kinase [Rubritalea squalenifaciens DSM 18772]|uniref:Protein-arginine kinase n=1 Tax=Rubritalea squalenifaciens DSM 18772 TaxID=1123071 RepID=A0A1M6R4P0_9BACT|nr:protein arginine kinase [Rubritalea squalenifaciens]SHK27308.1 arginine kinase [Rubritalea squalenifaciens DSM 18772]
MKHPADWMIGKNADNAVVITSRIRLARNLRDVSFPGWAKKTERVEVMNQIRPVVEDLRWMKKAFSQELSELDSMQKQVLVERHLISREQAARAAGSAAVIDRGQRLSLMINEEDHLRMQSIRAGLHLREAHDLLNEVDESLEQELEFAFDRQLGYLTACPTNLGTGMRASAMLHLPALVLSDQIGQVLQAVSKIGLAVRGLFGEGTESLGHLFQISNQSTLGESEDAIINRLERVINQVANHERNARLKMMEEEKGMISDKIGRAYGILSYAQLFDSIEAFAHISLIRLGADLGFFPEETMHMCDSLMMEIQPAHLQMIAGTELEPEKRDIIRAEILRDRLQSLDAPVNNNTNNQAEGDGPDGDHPNE